MSGASANAAFWYVPDDYDSKVENLMGRHAAGEGFLKGFVEHADADVLYCYTRSSTVADQFATKARTFGNSRPVTWVDERVPARLAAVGAVHCSDPDVSPQAWRRRAGNQRSYSITGVTHTLAEGVAMDCISATLTAPLQDWDALVCTSWAARRTVQGLLERQQAYLANRLGATRFPRPLLPVIPLGVDAKSLTPCSDARRRWRQQLGIGENDIAVLYLGRLSFHEKAHPLPMYLGLEQAARASGKRIHLLHYGRFPHAFVENAFRAGARELCPSITCHFLDGKRDDLRGAAWQSADIFTSLSDNIQETFGLTLIEAMAAGLPAVVSDWDGYKDTVRHGVDGFRVPTICPPRDWCEDLADRYTAGLDTYGRYAGYVSQFVAVAPEACAHSYLTLIRNPQLRARFGAAARQRALDCFDWRLVVHKYQELWAELAARRVSAEESAARRVDQPSHPTRADPFLAFATYATETLSDEHLVEACPQATPAAFDEIFNSPLIHFVRDVVPNESTCHHLLLELTRKGKMRVGELTADLPPRERALKGRSLIWFAKLGLVRIMLSSARE